MPNLKIPRISPPVKNVKVIGEEAGKKELFRREKLLKLKRFGKPGRKISAKRVPKSPKIVIKNRPKTGKRKGIYGYEAIIHGRGESSEPGKSLYVTKKGFFENARGTPNPITYKFAKKGINSFVERIQRKYLGRLSPISIEIRYITRNKSSDSKQHFAAKKRTK